ncbi:MAG: tRNA-(ms[2]io[6]A)-hydroxylase [Myxococcales bacterium]|nr:tRNA-(ms[2]io[6]A)-hydroxylase [Myxococcales bacterium]
MLCLRSATQDQWLARAIANTREILMDHAHCERKAATQALMLLGRFPDAEALVGPMLALAREELEHFEVVLALLRSRNWPLDSLIPSGYQAQLHAHCRKQMPGKLVDLLLVAALIEARSCERFKLLSEHHPDPELRAAFRDLLEAEARHHATFVRLAHNWADREVVRARLDELAHAEVVILEGMPPLARIHA